MKQYEYLLVETSVDFSMTSIGTIVIEGAGLGVTANASHAFSLRIGWSKGVVGIDDHTTGILTSTKLLTEAVYTTDYNGKLAIVLPAGLGSSVIVTYIGSPIQEVNTSGWKVHEVTNSYVANLTKEVITISNVVASVSGKISVGTATLRGNAEGNPTNFVTSTDPSSILSVKTGSQLKVKVAGNYAVTFSTSRGWGGTGGTTHNTYLRKNGKTIAQGRGMHDNYSYSPVLGVWSGWLEPTDVLEVRFDGGNRSGGFPWIMIQES